MCFSAEASLTMGAVLLSMGLYSSVNANKYNKNFLLLSLIPIFFAIQQFTEGLIWLNLGGAEYFPLTSLTRTYLFFAFFFWPAYIPQSVYQLEENEEKKAVLKKIGFLGFILGPVLYLPVVFELIPIKVAVVNHSLSYGSYHAPILFWLFSLTYGVIVLFPFLYSSNSKIKVLGMLILISLLASYTWLFYAFTSVWCFFAAFISLYVGYFTYQLKNHPLQVV